MRDAKTLFRGAMRYGAYVLVPSILAVRLEQDSANTSTQKPTATSHVSVVDSYGPSLFTGNTKFTIKPSVPDEPLVQSPVAPPSPFLAMMGSAS